LTSKAHSLGPWQGMARLQRPSLTNVFRVASEMQSGRKFRGIRSNILPPLAEKRKQERIPSPGHAPGICLCSDPFSNCKDQNFSAALGGHIPRARSGRSRAGKGPPGLPWRFDKLPQTTVTLDPLGNPVWEPTTINLLRNKTDGLFPQVFVYVYKKGERTLKPQGERELGKLSRQAPSQERDGRSPPEKFCHVLGCGSATSCPRCIDVKNGLEEMGASMVSGDE
jgi:hypothetical protein